MSTSVIEDTQGHGWTRDAILIVGLIFCVFLGVVVVGMLTHRTDHPTILHSWNDFYSWIVNSNFAGIFLGLLIPTIPLAVIAEVHHRRTIKKLTFHRELIKEHHELLKEIRDKLNLDSDSTPAIDSQVPPTPGD